MSERFPQFDAKRDNELIADGTHFYCHTHLSAVPLAEKSLDERYCQQCFKILSDEAALLPSKGVNRRPSWIPRPISPTTPLLSIDQRTGTIKRADIGNPTPPSFETNNDTATKHAGGRPKKDGDVSRVTEWRRRKEQGVMI